jgi:predicted nucleic acid-binding protein
LTDRAVIDSTCLIALERIDRLDLLPKLFREAFAPRRVVQEFGRIPDWLLVREIRNRTLVDEIGEQLDAGESEVIALCLEIAGAVAVLDEKKARRIAREKQLKVTGTIGITLNAKRRGLVTEVKPVLDSLNAAGFRLSRELYREALRLASEGS